MRTIQGKITDSNSGIGIAFASIALGLLDGSEWFAIGTGTTTDLSGNYSLTYVPGGSSNERFQVRHVSYNPEFIDPNVDAADVSLTPASYQVDEVVIDGTPAWVDVPGPFQKNLLWFALMATAFIALVMFSVNGANNKRSRA